MIIHRFLHWMNEAPHAARAEAASALARAYLYSDLAAEERERAEAALTLLAHDPVTNVRRAIADALAASSATPHHIALALANDVEEVAICMIGLSPVLNDSDLINLATNDKLSILLAIAHRPYISPGLVAALVELGDEETCTLLLHNTGAVLTPSVFTRLAERFGGNEDVCEGLLKRPDLPVTVRQMLMVRMSETLAEQFSSRNTSKAENNRSMAREACDRATIALATRPDCDLPSLVRHLRKTAQLTPTLILRTLLSGNIHLFTEMLVQLTGLPAKRVSGLVEDISGRGFSALYLKAGLPLSAYRAFAASLQAWHTMADTNEKGVLLQKNMVQRALTVCEPDGNDELDELISLLRHFADEATREAAITTAVELSNTPLQLRAA